MRSKIRRRIALWPGGTWLLTRFRSVRRHVNRRLRPELRPHRTYVGGLWGQIGRAQFEFMLRRGLSPGDVLVDIGCGSLRGGRLFIAYLDPGHYLGLDHNAWLIEDGLRYEIPPELIQEQRPEFVVSARFEFEKFSVRPTYGIAQSLFSHLATSDIRLCLEKLRAHMASNGRLYATFIPKERAFAGHVDPNRSADEKIFAYEPEQLLAIGRETGWEGEHLGQWGHPCGQEMIEFRAES